jgi:hypothetical protein
MANTTDAIIESAPASAYESVSATTKRTIARYNIEIGIRRINPAKEKRQPPGTAKSRL